MIRDKLKGLAGLLACAMSVNGCGSTNGVVPNNPNNGSISSGFFISPPSV